MELVFHEASEADVNRAMDAQPRHSTLSRRGAEDTDISQNHRHGIKPSATRALARTRRTGLPLARLQASARGRAVSSVFAQVAREGSWVDGRIDPASRQAPLPQPDLRRMLIPVGGGRVGSLASIGVLRRKNTASMFAASCPSSSRPIAHPEQAAGRPRRACGGGDQPACFLITVEGDGQHRHSAASATAAVGFTGSHAAGRALLTQRRRAHANSVFAEMSSLNPLIVLPGALRERG